MYRYTVLVYIALGLVLTNHILHNAIWSAFRHLPMVGQGKNIQVKVIKSIQSN